MSRIDPARNSAVVRWVHVRRVGGGPIRRSRPTAHVSQTSTSIGAGSVRHVHIWQTGPRRGLLWLDDDQRQRIAPLASWDVSEQLLAAAALYRSRNDA